MKNIIIIILVLVSLNSNSQIIDYNNFDNELIDSLLLYEINRYRNEVGSSALTYSKVIHDSISIPNTHRMLTDRKIIKSKIKKQLSQSLFNSVLQKNNDRLNKYGDVSTVISSNGFSESTYELLAFNILTNSISFSKEEEITFSSPVGKPLNLKFTFVPSTLSLNRKSFLKGISGIPFG